jgi:hypothetical protein
LEFTFGEKQLKKNCNRKTQSNNIFEKMKRLTKFIEKNNSGKKVLSLFILTNVVYVYMLKVTIPKTMEFSNGMKLLDMMPTGYNQSYVHELFRVLGENGRKMYLTNQIPVDMIYPLLFGLTYSLLLYRSEQVHLF